MRSRISVHRLRGRRCAALVECIMKGAFAMEWLERLNHAVGYIEAHLEEEIDYGAAARIACCSTFHFQRMFSYIAGMPLSEYIRRRRMTCAALALQRGEEKVIGLALRYGYDSPPRSHALFGRARHAAVRGAPSRRRAQGLSSPQLSYHRQRRHGNELPH